MRRIIHYRQGYKIVINNKFYEVSNGNRVIHFGALRHRPTLQEVWNKTVGLKLEERLLNGKRTKAYNKMDCVINCCKHYSSSIDNLYIK